MWEFGHSWGLNSTATPFFDLVNNKLDFIRNYTYQKWGRIIPVTHAVDDDPFYYNFLAK